MSAQCWCYTCAGRIVTRKTFISHGRKNKPDAPVRKAPPLPMVSMPDVGDETHDVHAHVLEEEDSDDEVDPFEDPLGLADDDTALRSGSAQLSAAEVTLFMMDWMCTHKVSLKCARHVYITIDTLSDIVDTFVYMSTCC